MSLTRGSKHSNTEPRYSGPNKAEKRLASRIAAYDKHGKNPRGGDNPSNAHGTGHDMHKPGSENARKYGK